MRISLSKRTGSSRAYIAPTRCRATSHVPRVRQQSLMRRGGRVIPLSDRPAVARLFGQLERGLEEVHEQAEQSIEPRQCRRGVQPLVAPVADGVPNPCTVLLLDPGLVVLAIRTTPCELHTRVPAVVLHGLVHEHAVVVRVEPEQRERKQLAQLAQDLRQQLLFATSNGAHSVQPVAMSVSVRVCTKLPFTAVTASYTTSGDVTLATWRHLSFHSSTTLACHY